MAEVKWNGKLWHCSVCGAFSSRKEDVRCSHLAGSKAFGGGGQDYLEIADDPLPSGLTWLQILMLRSPADEKVWREYEARWERKQAEQRRRLQAEAEQAIQRSRYFSVCPCLPVVR